MNKVILIGRAGQDPKKYDTVAFVNLATDDGYGDKKETNWHSLVFAGKLKDVVLKWIKKGDQLAVEGRLNVRDAEEKGVKFKKTSVFVDRLEMLGGKPKEDSDGKPF